MTATAAFAGARRSSSEPLWRALAVFRFASVGYAALRLAFIDEGEYSRPDWAWAVIAVMAAWTAGTTIAYARPERRSRLLLCADLAVTVGLMMSTPPSGRWSGTAGRAAGRPAGRRPICASWSCPIRQTG